MDKNLSEHGEKLDEKTKTEVQEALEAAKKGSHFLSIIAIATTHAWMFYSPTRLFSRLDIHFVHFVFLSVDAEVDIETLKEAVTNLSNASMKIGQAIYSKKGDETNPPDNEDADKKKEDTQEAEFTEKKK